MVSGCLGERGYVSGPQRALQALRKLVGPWRGRHTEGYSCLVLLVPYKCFSILQSAICRSRVVCGCWRCVPWIECRSWKPEYAKRTFSRWPERLTFALTTRPIEPNSTGLLREYCSQQLILKHLTGGLITPRTDFGRLGQREFENATGPVRLFLVSNDTSSDPPLLRRNSRMEVL